MKHLGSIEPDAGRAAMGAVETVAERTVTMGGQASPTSRTPGPAGRHQSRNIQKNSGIPGLAALASALLWKVVAGDLS